MTTKQQIINQAEKLFALQGYEGVSMRELAKQCNIAPSVLYYYFADKDVLLKAMFDSINTELGKQRALLPQLKSAQEMLLQRVIFQLDNAEKVTAVLKYYLSYRQVFKKLKLGFVPEKAYLHIEEVLEYGLKTKEFAVKDVVEDAKVITHAINGFILEYYPKTPTGAEKIKLAKSITSFLLRALIAKNQVSGKKNKK
jgi:AcrR family transcriptional regulator